MTQIWHQPGQSAEVSSRKNPIGPEVQDAEFGLKIQRPLFKPRLLRICAPGDQNRQRAQSTYKGNLFVPYFQPYFFFTLEAFSSIT